MNSKYQFTAPIKAELNRFTATLSIQEDTKRSYRNYTGIFLQWMDEQQLTNEQVRTVDVLDFMASIAEHTSKEIQQCTLRYVRQYFTWKQHPHNPVMGIRLQGRRRHHLGRDLLDREILDGLYRDYPMLTLPNHRDRVILGLVVYQGLSCNELCRLQIDDIDLSAGKLRVPGGRKTNSRKLSFEGIQIMELNEYIQTVRPQFLKQNSGQLFLSVKGNEAVKNILSNLVKVLKEMHPKVNSLYQLRRSVIADWLKSKDVRIVQYMAGHKNVSSTEAYQVINLEDLQHELDKHHPLG